MATSAAGLRRFAAIAGAAALAAVLVLMPLGSPRAAATTPNWAATVASAGGYAAAHVSTGGVAVVDRVTGQLWTGGEATSRVSAASTVKAFVAADLLYRNARGLIHLSSYDWSQMTVMITQSSNSAMEYLYNRYGGVTIIKAVIARYGLSQTLPPNSPSFWGFTAVTAHDYALFLARATADPTIGWWLIGTEARSQQFVNGFDQWFGIPASGVRPFAIKQGWTCCDTGDILNSTGFVGPNWRYAVAILTSASTATNHRAIINTVAQLLIPGGKISSDDPLGTLEAVTAKGNVATVHGWSYDPNATSSALKIVVYADGAIVAYGPTTVPRPDVNAVYRITGIHGYSIPFHLSTGVHRICTYGINLGPGLNTTLGCRTITVG
ncbi:MAG: hypothetical protein DLM57_03390 [Pseudonocardiales bacterium]|nr:MAG: hypothetical protein DLM57_03390 [Pseudonocardiales bacterium]